MAVFTINFEQSGMVRLPLSCFSSQENIHDEAYAALEKYMDVSTCTGKATDVDWLDRVVMIYEQSNDDVTLMIGGEASVTVKTDKDIENIEDFGYQNLALSFAGNPWGLDDKFNVKHSEVVA